MAFATPDYPALQAAIAGEVVLPGSSGYESARKPAIANFHDIRPQAVVLCASAADVAEVMSFVARCGSQLAVRSGGHCYAGRSSTGGIVIDTTPMRSVSVSDGVATIGAGARLGQVYDALAEQGLTIPAGCGPDVGIAGLTLGGGLGILGRQYGLTSDRLVAADVVLADGRVVDCDAHHHEDLFWALRGAGGCRFGVVTSLRFRPVLEPEATCLHLVWSHADAAAVIDAWQAWAPAGPDELAASLLLTLASDPEQAPLVHLFGAMIGSEADASYLIDGLVARAGADPVSTIYTRLPYRDAKRHLAENGPSHGSGYLFSKSGYFRHTLPRDAVAALVRNVAVEPTPGESRVVDFMPWGGAYNRVRPEATAFVHRDARFLVKHDVVVSPRAPAAHREAARRWLAQSWASVHRWGSGGMYPNFPDPDLDDWSRAYHGANLERLRRVKVSYDPDDIFGFHKP